MSQQEMAGSRLKSWLMFRSGSRAGTRLPIPDGTMRIGRAPDNDAVIDGPDAATISLYHLEISRNRIVLARARPGQHQWHVDKRRAHHRTRDRSARDHSTREPGTGDRGRPGRTLAPLELDRTVEISKISIPQPPAGGTSSAAAHEGMLSDAVTRARDLRAHGLSGETMTIMREVIERALRHSHRRHRLIAFCFLAALVAVSSLGIWQIVGSEQGKDARSTLTSTSSKRICRKPSESADADRLLSRLDDYEGQAESLQRRLLFRLGGSHDDSDFVTRQLRSLMAEFGAEVYSIPPDFIDRVNHYIEQDQGPDRPIVARALSEAGGQIRTIRRILQDEQLPPDLAYIPIVESALTASSASAAGAVGPWQFTAPTAKAYGLRVDDEVDERKDLVKSTRASCKYLRDLILDFGSGSSVMLALAAYNSGAGTVKQAVTRTVRDPIKQRNFWYLYRARALPLETREYVPKVFAAILIGRSPGSFRILTSALPHGDRPVTDIGAVSASHATGGIHMTYRSLAWKAADRPWTDNAFRFPRERTGPRQGSRPGSGPGR